MSNTEIERLFNGALVKWFKMSLGRPSSLKSYKDLVDGKLLNEVFLKIDSQPMYNGLMTVDGNSTARVNNLEIVFKNIRYFYEEELGHVILKVPDVIKLGEEPDSHVDEMRLLLTMLLGCAVQCPNKDDFISDIMSESTSFQMEIMDYIKQVTERGDIILSSHHLDVFDKNKIFDVIRTLSAERNSYRESQREVANVGPLNNANILLDKTEYCPVLSDAKSFGACDFDVSSNSRRNSSVYQASDSSDNSQVWKMRQEQDKLKQSLLDCLEELDEARKSLEKQKEENWKLNQEAKLVKEYRDRLDAVLEKTVKMEKLEHKVVLYEQKLSDMEYHKVRSNELIEDNKMLQKTIDMLYDEMDVLKCKADRLYILEEEVIRYKELWANQMRKEDENARRALLEDTISDHSDKEVDDDVFNGTITSETDLMPEEVNFPEQNLSQELSFHNQYRVLQLELANQTLTETIDNLEDRPLALEIKHFKKKYKTLKVKCKKLESVNDKLKAQVKEFENICNGALNEIENLINEAMRWQFQAIKSDRKLIAQKCKYETLFAKYLELSGRKSLGKEERETLENEKDNNESDVEHKFNFDSDCNYEDFVTSECDTVIERLVQTKNAAIRKQLEVSIKSKKQENKNDGRNYAEVISYNAMALTAMYLFMRFFETKN